VQSILFLLLLTGKVALLFLDGRVGYLHLSELGLGFFFNRSLPP
jgi:hypothetical protein